MHTSIVDDTKKRFPLDGAIRGLFRANVITEMVEQWLKANEAPPSENSKV